MGLVRLRKWTLAGALAFGAIGCNANGGGPPAAEAAGPTASATGASAPAAALAQTVSALSPEEQASLRYMREEEKVARDVYRALDRYGQIFLNIQQSEQRHMDAVLGLLQKYGLEDPAAGSADGVFQEPRLQGLYDQLIAQGAPSAQAALEVGALIEETDVRDIRAALLRITHPDIVQVYENLESGSYNHLRAFVSRLEAMGGTYSPKVLDEQTYRSILGG